MVNCIFVLWEARFSEAVYVLALHKVCCSFTLELLSLSTFLTPSILLTLIPLILQILLTHLIVSRSKTSKGSSKPQLSEPPVRSGRQESVGEWSYMWLVSQARPNQPQRGSLSVSRTRKEGSGDPCRFPCASGHWKSQRKYPGIW